MMAIEIVDGVVNNCIMVQPFVKVHLKSFG